MKYLDGTTDVTRTVHYGKPSAHEKACYTAVGGFVLFPFCPTAEFFFNGYLKFFPFTKTSNVFPVNLINPFMLTHNIA